MAEPAVASVGDAVDEATAALLPVLDSDDLPTDVLGHSFGALLAAEFVTRMERERPGRVRCFVVSAKVPPPDPSPELTAALHDEHALVEWLVGLGGTPVEFLEDPGMRAMVLDPLRADLTASMNHQGEPARPSTPLLVVAADADTTAPPSAVESWNRYTTGPTEALRLHGGHHALFDQAERLHMALRRPGVSLFPTGSATPPSRVGHAVLGGVARWFSSGHRESGRPACCSGFDRPAAPDRHAQSLDRRRMPRRALRHSPYRTGPKWSSHRPPYP